MPLEVQLENGAELLVQGLMQHPVTNCWNTQQACFAVVLGYLNAQNRGGLVTSAFNLMFDGRPMFAQVSRQIVYRFAVYSRGAFVLSHLIVRLSHVFFAENLRYHILFPDCVPLRDELESDVVTPMHPSSSQLN